MAVSHEDIAQVHAHMREKLSAVHQLHDNAIAAFRLDEKLKADPTLLEEFKKDPIAVAKREGFTVPEGFHLHFINENNEYFPPEGDAISQLQRGKTHPVWGRVEVRWAVGAGCIAGCGACGAGSLSVT